jgi:hypothetical protein
LINAKGRAVCRGERRIRYYKGVLQRMVLVLGLIRTEKSARG